MYVPGKIIAQIPCCRKILNGELMIGEPGGLPRRTFYARSPILTFCAHYLVMIGEPGAGHDRIKCTSGSLEVGDRAYLVKIGVMIGELGGRGPRIPGSRSGSVHKMYVGELGGRGLRMPEQVSGFCKSRQVWARSEAHD